MKTEDLIMAHSTMLHVRVDDEIKTHDVWFRQQVQAGLDAANAGDVIASAEVEAEAVAWRAETRRKRRSQSDS